MIRVCYYYIYSFSLRELYYFQTCDCTFELTKDIRSTPNKNRMAEDSKLFLKLKTFQDKTIMQQWDYHYVDKKTENTLFNMAKKLKSYTYKGKNNIKMDIEMLYRMYNGEMALYNCIDAIYIYTRNQSQI